ncbi:hypothetical protein EW146_g445 [Bondarzewia mesenterica]|uniref:Uncharacterized protein n=1 Tax=Bondarzewia mesenterica TaxID=1095465 RepID=A0A4S4M6X0_9AGAM|nr:hypothetical protein EW146_g445 [Bondarzewia mesenterica]
MPLLNIVSYWLTLYHSSRGHPFDSLAFQTHFGMHRGLHVTWVASDPEDKMPPPLDDSDDYEEVFITIAHGGSERLEKRCQLKASSIPLKIRGNPISRDDYNHVLSLLHALSLSSDPKAIISVKESSSNAGKAALASWLNRIITLKVNEIVEKELAHLDCHPWSIIKIEKMSTYPFGKGYVGAVEVDLATAIFGDDVLLSNGFPPSTIKEWCYHIILLNWKRIKKKYVHKEKDMLVGQKAVKEAMIPLEKEGIVTYD